MDKAGNNDIVGAIMDMTERQVAEEAIRRSEAYLAEVGNAPTVMGQNQKDVKNLETEGGHGEEVDGNQMREVIVQKGAPGLRRRLSGRAPCIC